MGVYHQLSMSEFAEQEVKSSEKQLLISLQPGPYERILHGSKRYEFRKKFITEPCSAFIYVTAPTAAICALMSFGTPQFVSVERIEELAEEQELGTGEILRHYMQGLEGGYAIPIQSWKTFEPLSLTVLRRDFSTFQPPQLYVILDNYPELGIYLRRWLTNHVHEQQ